MVAFEVGRVTRPYNIEIFYRPLFGGHLQRWLRTRKLCLLTSVQTRDHLGSGCGASLHHHPQIYYASALKHPRQTSLSHATSLLRWLPHTEVIEAETQPRGARIVAPLG